MGIGRAFDDYLNQQLSDPEFRDGYERKLAHLQGFVELMHAMERAREARNLTKKDIADRMGRHPSAVSRLLCGEGPNPTLETIADLADALGVSVSIELKNRRSKGAPALAVRSTF